MVRGARLGLRRSGPERGDRAPDRRRLGRSQGGDRGPVHPRRDRLHPWTRRVAEAAMTVFEKPITAQPEDIDELGHVNNAAWVRWIQDMATAHWRTVAPPAHVDAFV